MDFKSLQSLVGMLAETLRGSGEARDAFTSLLKRPGDLEELRAWIRRFVPMGGNPLRPEILGEQIEEVARMFGFVPRARHLDLLERHEILGQKLAEAEKTIIRLQAMLGTGGSEGAARKLVDGLGSAVSGTLKLQAELVRSIGDIFSKVGNGEVVTPAPEKAAERKPEPPAAD